MCCKETWFLLVLFHLGVDGNSQLIGEEKKYVFLEQVVLERMRSAVLEMTNRLETRVGRLEEENKRILSELKSIKDAKFPPETVNGCPTSSKCAVRGLICPRFHMDPTTLYNATLSKDNLTLSNRRLESTYDWPSETDPTRVYHGVKASKLTSYSSTNWSTLYFETEIFYRIEEKLRETNLIFEVAFASEKAIGRSHTVGQHMEAWSVNAYFSVNTRDVTLFVYSNGSSVMHSEKLSDATSGTEKNVTFGFFLNRTHRTIAVFDIKMKRMIYTFTVVKRLNKLWPVFGVYQADKTFVRIRLNTQRDILSIPCELI